ncbi:MAG TPA: RIP metalloprotease RseP [Arenimonas sp.]|nr:RIP metalloprotease RseP [Arenimonas sp.]
MSTVISPIFWYILTIGILVTIHEWGHFIVARWCGVHVQTFSIGFGRPLYSRLGKNGTQYQIALIPLGGYVKMLDEGEGDVPAALLAQAFNRQSVQKRFAIVAAGPIANLVLCILLLWGVFTLGNTELKPLLGPSEGIALKAGFQSGDDIVAINNIETHTWNDVMPLLTIAAMDRKSLAIEIQTPTGNRVTRQLDLSILSSEFDQSQLMQEIGFTPYIANPSPIVGQVQADGPSVNRLRIGDMITSIDNHELKTFSEIPEILAKSAKKDQALSVQIDRQGTPIQLSITPIQIEDQGQNIWRLGIGSINATTIIQYSPLEALPKAIHKTFTMTKDSFAIIGRLITGAASTDNLAGPLSIARAADNQASWGFSAFLSFLAAISLALCIMNLLPIPMLDGGHLFYFAFEWLTGKPVTESFQAVGQFIGLFLLVGLFGIAIYNDIFRIIS